MSHKHLLGALDAQRRHVLGILSGLTAEDLRRPVLPSGWSCLDLVNHLALDVELFWFRAVVAGQPDAIAELDVVGDAWRVDPNLPPDQVLAGYRTQIEHADAVLATTSLDSAPAWWPDGLFGDWRLATNGEVLLHVITETACHAGHLDAARELLDGHQWLVVTG
ncbi:DinB family protein [Allokutzneria albata]|uniref:DinB superfamily protein n=1 Tax=Allokutzneria albata TaxID=211114 RepID=A0A1G9SY95_ALLAB|nr:DinB family protein [Allokutzneria albata]SDM40399.1 Protein of unknown function [Allokutzneria albata]